MNHHDAVERLAAEKYLLNEMSPAEREEFEEHYFGCRECAAEVRATAAFLDEAKKELEQPKREAVIPRKRSRWDWLWRPAFAGPVFASLLLVIVFQNLTVSPRAAGGTNEADLPEILPTLSLIGAGSRGAASLPSLTARKGQPVLVVVDIPAAEQYSAYSCVLVAPGGAVAWRVSVSPEQARDTVSIRAPAAPWERGEYTLLVQGIPGAAQEKPAEIASYRFTLNTSD
jgi:hypothetical protein